MRGRGGEGVESKAPHCRLVRRGGGAYEVGLLRRYVQGAGTAGGEGYSSTRQCDDGVLRLDMVGAAKHQCAYTGQAHGAIGNPECVLVREREVHCTDSYAKRHIEYIAADAPTGV